MGRRQPLEPRMDAFAKAMVDTVRAVIAGAADDIVKEMKSRCPVDTGRLASTIKTQAFGEIGQKITAGGTQTLKDGYDYAKGVEFGNHHAPANPFFYSGYRAQKKRAKAKIERAMRSTVNSVRTGRSEI